VVRCWIERLKADLDGGERSTIYGVLQEAVPNFTGNARQTGKQ